eukprot:sb/3470143/
MDTVCVSASCISTTILAFLAYKLSQKPKPPPPKHPSTEALFFPDRGIQCPYYKTSRGCLNTSCEYLHEPLSLPRLCEILRSARHTLDVCMFVISSPELMSLLIEIKERGVRVRCICNAEDIDGLQPIRSAGIPFRFDRSDYLMHNKFVVIDSRAVTTGSYNFSRGNGNRENVIISYTRNVIDAYKAEFEEMWQLYSGNDFRYNCFKEKVYR